MANPLRVGIIIPARYASGRYPGKPLALIRGATGIAKTLIERTWLAAKAVPGVEQVWVATDDGRIADATSNFGGQVLMTAVGCRNGTERCADAIRQLSDPPDIIVNFQGDALLTPPYIVQSLIAHLQAHDEDMVATPAIACTPTLYRHLIEDQAAGRVGGTTVVFNTRRKALYFSKRVIPHLPPAMDLSGHVPIYLHMGVYAYRMKALNRYVAEQPSLLEELEGLEQLRFLDCGIPVAAVSCDAPPWDVIELNNPSDLAPIEENLRLRNLE